MKTPPAVKTTLLPYVMLLTLYWLPMRMILVWSKRPEAMVPICKLLEPLVRFIPALKPMPILLFERTFISALYPIATELEDELEEFPIALFPMATLLEAVIKLAPAPY